MGKSRFVVKDVDGDDLCVDDAREVYAPRTVRSGGVVVLSSDALTRGYAAHLLLDREATQALIVKLGEMLVAFDAEEG